MLSPQDREFIEGIIVKSHDGRMASMSGLFRDLDKRMTERLDIFEERMDKFDVKLQPLWEGALAGKLSYKFVLGFLGFISAIGGVILLVKQIGK